MSSCIFKAPPLALLNDQCTHQSIHVFFFAIHLFSLHRTTYLFLSSSSLSFSFSLFLVRQCHRMERPVSWYAEPFYFNSPLFSFYFHFSFFFLTRKNLKIRTGARCYRNGVSLAVVSGGSNGADATGNPVGRDKSTKLLGPARLEICKSVVIRLWIYEACTNDAQCSHW